MLAHATIKYVRMSPRKVRYIMGPLRQQTVAQALRMLSGVNRRASEPVTKAIASAFANAKQADPTLHEDQVIITRLTADGGPSWKRFRAAAFGRAMGIRKPTSHIRVELERAGGRGPAAVPPRAAASVATLKPAARKRAAASRLRSHGT